MVVLAEPIDTGMVKCTCRCGSFVGRLADMKAGGVFSAELDFEDVIGYSSVTAAEKAEYSIADENGVTKMCALMTDYEAFEDGGLITFELDGNIISVDSVKDERFLHFVGKFVSVRLRNAVVWPYDMP